MTRSHYLLLFTVGLLFTSIIALFEPIPGYLDSDYYFAGGLQLVKGNGFTEPYLWNYLDDPAGLPHPSHSYWMPLASIVSAGGMLLAGQSTYSASRILFILIAALVPPVTASLAYSFSNRTNLALISGFLAVFSGYHAPFLPVTDNFGIYILLGGFYFLLVRSRRPWFWFGVITGLMSLARNDGILWLGISVILIYLRKKQFVIRKEITSAFILLFAGFILIMAPWYVRNYFAYGSVIAPGGGLTLWMTSYNQTFTYPATKLSYDSWIMHGSQNIIHDRLWALGQNLQNAVAAHGSIILVPFIGYGIWLHRTDDRVKAGCLGWIMLLATMTLIFPFAGARGGFFHAGAAFQTLWWSLAPLGLAASVDMAITRGWFKESSQKIFQIMFIQVVLIITLFICWIRLFTLGWGEGEQKYPEVEKQLVESGAQPMDIVMVRNPPGYNMLTNRRAIVIPDGDFSVLLAVASRYGGNYLVLEPEAALPAIKVLYEQPEDDPRFIYLGEVDEIQLFSIVGE